MGLLLRFLRTPFRNKMFYIEAALWMGAARLAILAIPFRLIAPFLGRHMAVSDEGDGGVDRRAAISVARAVNTLSLRLPWECTCLVQAVSAKMMLKRRKIPSTLYLGVIKEGNDGLAAHAWLRAGNLIVTGRAGMERYTVVSTFA